MPEPGDILQQQSLLQTYRLTLSHYLHQKAILGEAYMPPSIAHGIIETRSQIRRIKDTLQRWGMTVEDLPVDNEEVEPTLEQAGLPYQSTESGIPKLYVSPEGQIFLGTASIELQLSVPLQHCLDYLWEHRHRIVSYWELQEAIFHNYQEDYNNRSPKDNCDKIVRLLMGHLGLRAYIEMLPRSGYALRNFRDDGGGFLTFDSCPLLKEHGEIWQWQYGKFASVSDLLDNIYFRLYGKIPPFTYSDVWLLRDRDSGDLFTDIGKEKEIDYLHHRRDNRKLQDVGILSGMNFELVPPYKEMD